VRSFAPDGTVLWKVERLVVLEDLELSFLHFEGGGARRGKPVF
jgi:hypothetical protein